MQLGLPDPDRLEGLLASENTIVVGDQADDARFAGNLEFHALECKVRSRWSQPRKSLLDCWWEIEGWRVEFLHKDRDGGGDTG